jgi:hypothetical protein
MRDACGGCSSQDWTAPTLECPTHLQAEVGEGGVGLQSTEQQGSSLVTDVVAVEGQGGEGGGAAGAGYIQQAEDYTYTCMSPGHAAPLAGAQYKARCVCLAHVCTSDTPPPEHLSCSLHVGHRHIRTTCRPGRQVDTKHGGKPCSNPAMQFVVHLYKMFMTQDLTVLPSSQ